MRKKWLTLLLIGLCVMCLVGCGMKEKPEKNGITIVTTIFPEYDWVKNILGSRFSEVDLRMLLGNGVDLHSYQPSTDDLLLLMNCDLVIYVGGESDEWIKSAISQNPNPNRVEINLLDVLGEDAKTEEIIEGMEADDEPPSLDEHIWLSLKNARNFVSVIAEVLGRIDPENARLYAENSERYVSKLLLLDDMYRKEVEKAPYRTLIFGDRFPFRYLIDDYDLSYYAAFSGCSAESEASFETIAFLAERLKEFGLPSILILEGSDGKIARTIADSSGLMNVEVLKLDSMQSVTFADILAGADYLRIMEENLSVLRQALGAGA